MNGRCSAVFCGNGITETGEACDDGNRIDTDACNNICARGTGESCTLPSQCDTGYCTSGICQPCSDNSQCQSSICELGRCVSPTCGNGRLEGNEACDDGNVLDADSCSPICRLEMDEPCSADGQCSTQLCQDGMCRVCLSDTQCGEERRCMNGSCFTGEELAGIANFCGNGKVDPGETCDRGIDNSNASNALCRPDCTLARCGDAVMDSPIEGCDDGNTIAGDGCNEFCKLERTAGGEPVLPGSIVELPVTPNDGGTGRDGGSVTETPIHAPVGETGPAAIAIMAAGSAAGWAWVRRKKR